MAQLPEAQIAVDRGKEQATPHILQLLASLCRSTSQPLVVLPSQSPRPVAQAVRVHTPPTQAPTPPAKLHALAQRPQSESVVERSVSQPLEGSPSQSPKPVAQA